MDCVSEMFNHVALLFTEPLVMSQSTLTFGPVLSATLRG